MKTKPILCPARLRHVPRQFSWIDQRLVRQRHIQGRSPEALALYLLLCTVADAQGVSYYSDAGAGALLTFSAAQLRAARAELVAAGLIAWRAPFYQVLSLEPGYGTPLPAGAPPPQRAAPKMPAMALERQLEMATEPLEVPEPRATGQVRSIGDILRAMMKETAEQAAP